MLLPKATGGLCMDRKPTYEELERKLKTLEGEVIGFRKAEDALQKRTRDLDARIKGLNCLYGISHLVEKTNASFEQVTQGTVDLIAAAWQYPEIACARIILRGQAFKTKNFKKTRWKQTCKIVVQGKIIGSVAVYYLEEKKTSDKGPFLKEESVLIKSIAGRIGRIAEWMWTEKEIKLLKEKYEGLYNNAPVMHLSLDRKGIVVECNNTLLDKLGYPRNEFIGQHMMKFVTRKSAADFEKAFPELIETGKCLGAERQLVARNGEIIDTILNVTVEYDEHGKLLRTRAAFEDISKRKRAEELLQRSEEKYRSVVKNANEGINVAQDGVLKLVNPKILEYTGCSEQEMQSQPFVNFVHPHDRNMVFEHHRKVLSGEKKPAVFTYRIIDKDGRTRWIENNGVLINWEGRPATLNFMGDITDRRQMEDALYTSKIQKQAILDASIDRLRYVDKDMKIIWANQTTVMDMDTSQEEIKGQTCYKFFVGRDTPCKGCPTVKALATGKTERAVMYRPRSIGKKGESFWDTYSVPLRNKAGDIESFIQVARDITDQVQTKKHIHYLTQQLMKAQETERQRIARELHDNVAQELSLLKIGCETLFDGRRSVPVEIGQKIARISKIFQKTITAVRDMAYNIHPPILDELGFIPAVDQYCEEFSEKNKIDINFSAAGVDALNLDFDTKINLYRIIQEALNNIHKHANAHRATIRLVATWPNLILRIKDNGDGFDEKRRMKAAIIEKRMGIRSMKERASLLGGKMKIQSRTAQGTKIVIKIPYKEGKNGLQANHRDR
jgi:PAS domain S-box-containing protein